MDFLVSRSESVAFGQKSRYFTDQNRPKGGPREYYQIQKWMLQTVRAEEVDEKMRSFV